jgi:hypothetical protein
LWVERKDNPTYISLMPIKIYIFCLFFSFFLPSPSVDEEKGKGQRRNKKMTAYLDAERDQINKRGKKTV